MKHFSAGRQHCADAWVWSEDWRAYYAKSPTSRSIPKAQSLEQRANYRAEATAAFQKVRAIRARLELAGELFVIGCPRSD